MLQQLTTELGLLNTYISTYQTHVNNYTINRVSIIISRLLSKVSQLVDNNQLKCQIDNGSKDFSSSTRALLTKPYFRSTWRSILILYTMQHIALIRCTPSEYDVYGYLLINNLELFVEQRTLKSYSYITIQILRSGARGFTGIVNRQTRCSLETFHKICGNF